ncbi:MAG: hypothetical protein LC800_17325, partial [Acidobacteria bacterium]|nr:hypothetical protein [Acidobacteriota bacterium]
TQNTDEASFCRSCGANVSLIPQALTGQLAAPDDAGGVEGFLHGRRRRVPSIEQAVVPFCGGLGFSLVATMIMLFMPGGWTWGFWMFIPAFFMMGRGVAEYLKLQEYRKRLPPAGGAAFNSKASAVAPARAAAGALPPRDACAAAYAPGSVAEGTTKLLERDE